MTDTASSQAADWILSFPWCLATQGLYCDIRQLVQFIKEAHGNVFRRVALSALLDSAEKLTPGKKPEETEQEPKPSGSKRWVCRRQKGNDLHMAVWIPALNTNVESPRACVFYHDSVCQFLMYRIVLWQQSPLKLNELRDSNRFAAESVSLTHTWGLREQCNRNSGRRKG